MKKFYAFLSLTIICSAINLFAQSWTVYDASVLPTEATPAWTSGDVGTPPAVYKIINSFKPGNKVLFETTSNSGDKMTYKLGGTKPNNGTWIFRTKAGTKPSSMEFEFNAGNPATRINLRLYPAPKGGYIKLQYSDFTGVYPTDSTLDVTKWHIIRITVENGTTYKIYVDENVDPVIVCNGQSSTQSHILRFGDIGTTFTEGYLDWMAWDFSGAYAPGEGAPLPPELETTNQKADIVMIVNKDPLVAQRDDSTKVFLENLGYKVHPVGMDNSSNLLTRKETLLDSLNSADLVLIGRSVASSVFHSSRGRDIWNNEVQRPILLIHPYAARSYVTDPNKDLLSWFSTEGAHHLTGNKVNPGTLLTSKVLKPNHNLFAGVNISPDSIMPWSYTRDDGFYYDKKTNATVYNIHTCDSSIIIATWNPGQKYYQGAGPTIWASGFRAYCGFGNDEDNLIHYWSLTSEAQKVLKNGIDLLVNTHPNYTPYKGWNYTYLKNILVDNGSLTPDFQPDVLNYTLNLNAGNIVTITPVDSLPPAGSFLVPYFVEGGGTIDLGEKSDSTVIIKVISSTGKDTSNYVIHITADPAFDATLASLIVDPGTLEPSFSPQITDYTIKVSSTVSSVNITATPNNPEATVTGTGAFTNIPGTAIITVTSKNGSVTKQYKINIQVLSNDATLSSLTVTPGTITPAFSPSITSYTVKVPEGTTSVNITATANHAAATVTGTGTFTQIPGQATITVTAEDGITKQTYVLDISIETSLNQFSQNLITLYPNPVRNVLYVKSAEQILKISLYDVAGNQLMIIKPNSKTVDLTFENIKSGIYYLRIQTENNTFVRKITKN